MAAKCKEQQLLAVLSDLPADISENYIAKEVSLKAKQQGFKYYSCSDHLDVILSIFRSLN